MKKWIAGGICIILSIALAIGLKVKKNTLYDQQAAARWSEKGTAQLTVFYPNDMSQDDFYYLELEHKLQDEMEKESEQISFSDSISVQGSVDIHSDRGTVSTTAIGVKNNFFVFHPIALINGSYIGADDLMDDGIIIDEELAWRLFGSSDVAGMEVSIAGVPHFIKGVAKKADDKISVAAGLGDSICFMSMNSMSEYGKITGCEVYEVILPEPVKGFAKNMLVKVLGEGIVSRVEIVENTGRFDMGRLLPLVKQLGIRSMRNGNIYYPYFENIARAYEDMFAVLIMVQLLLVIYPAGLLIHMIIIFFRGNGYKKLKEKRRIIWKGLKELLLSRSAS